MNWAESFLHIVCNKEVLDSTKLGKEVVLIAVHWRWSDYGRLWE